jgi:hypothetical protein
MALLKITAHKPMTLVWWYNHRDDIDFSPKYQRRGRLWSQDDKAYLIDSIINGFDVPKLYMADFQFGQSNLNQKKLPYAIIDGKQRLEAIFDFFANKVVLRVDFKYRKDPSLHLAGQSLKDLKNNYPKVAEDFENASLDIMSVIAEDESDINEIFVRLNRSKPLTGAEVRNAIPGQVSEAIRLLGSHSFFADNIKFGVARATDLNAAAKILLFEYNGTLTSTKKADLDLFATQKLEFEKLELATRRTIDVLDLLAAIFIPKDPLLSSSGSVPIYYWVIRENQRESLFDFREFLLAFEAARKENRNAQRASGSADLDRELARYDTLSRSTNDQQSYVGRAEILNKAYKLWEINLF